jgi:hypothetical protein
VQPESAAGQLRLVREAPLGDLLPGGPPRRLEASGVLAADGRFYVVFDNVRSVAVLDADLDRVEGNALVPAAPGAGYAYEDIARDPVTGTVYLLVEAARRGTVYQARVEEYDRDLAYLSAGWLEFALPGPNKGVEGLSCVHRDGTTYLLGLVEGNRARDGAAGRLPGGGRILVFRRGRRNWKHHATIKLPREPAFEDYSGLAVRDDRIAVVSQQSSALWLGALAPGTWRPAGPGATYLFPRDAAGRVVYCTVEGVSFVGPDRIVAVSDRAKPDAPGRCRSTQESLHVFAVPFGTPAQAAAAGATSVRTRTPAAPDPGEAPVPPPVRALFQQRVAGDEALLRLAALRFAEAGMPAEVYADHPDELERLLRYVPESATLPMVHLNRRLDLLDPGGRTTVELFAARFAGRIAGLVVHDRAAMRDRLADVVEAMREVGRAGPARPTVFLEYAAGLGPAWHVELAERIADVELASVCVDVGHVGIEAARRALAAARPGLDVGALTPRSALLPDAVADVQRAVRAALPAVVDLVRAVGRLGKPVHLHLHDGHPVIRGLSDHFSFLARVPVPFDMDGRRSLDPLYGPAGLAAILRAATGACAPGLASFTLEIHQAEGRLPIGDLDLFGHWRDLTNAERMNYWLGVLADNHLLTRTVH